MPFKTGHANVENRNVRGNFPGKSKSFLSIGRFPRHFNTFVLHKGFYALTNKLVIFSNQYGNGHSKSP